MITFLCSKCSLNWTYGHTVLYLISTLCTIHFNVLHPFLKQKVDREKLASDEAI